MAAKTSRHRYGTKLRHCHPMYTRTRKNVTSSVSSARLYTPFRNRQQNRNSKHLPAVDAKSHIHKSVLILGRCRPGVALKGISLSLERDFVFWRAKPLADGDREANSTCHTHAYRHTARQFSQTGQTDRQTPDRCFSLSAMDTDT